MIIESENLYDWYMKYVEKYPLVANRTIEDVYQCAMESGYTKKQIDDLMDDIEQGGEEYAKLSKNVLPMTQNLTDFNKKTGIYEMKHLQTFEKFYDLNDEFASADPDETPEDKITITMDNVMDIPEINQTLTEQDIETLDKYFLEIDGESIKGFLEPGMTVLQAAQKIDDEGFMKEWLQNMLVALYPEKYEGYY